MGESKDCFRLLCNGYLWVLPGYVAFGTVFRFFHCKSARSLSRESVVVGHDEVGVALRIFAQHKLPGAAIRTRQSLSTTALHASIACYMALVKRTRIACVFLMIGGCGG